MFSVSLGILVAGSIAIQVEETKAMSADDTKAIVQQLSKALEKQTGDQLVVHSLKPNADCRSQDKCIGGILKKAQASEVVFVIAEKTPGTFKINLMRTSGGGLTPSSAKVDLPRAKATWGAFLTGAAIMLFPEGANLTPPIVAAARPTRPKSEPMSIPTIEIRKTLPAAKKPEPKPQPVAKKPEPKPQPVAKKPEPKPQPVAKKPEPKPQPVAKKPEPKPQPVAKKPEPKPQPVAKKPEPKPQPVAKKPEPKPQPVAKKPEPKPQPVAKKPEPKPQPVAKKPEPKPQPVAKKSTSKIPALVPINVKSKKKRVTSSKSKIATKKAPSSASVTKKIKLASTKRATETKKTTAKIKKKETKKTVSTSEMIARSDVMPRAGATLNPKPRTKELPKATSAGPINASTALPGLNVVPMTLDSPGNKPWPWLALGASILSAGVGTYFGIENQSLIAEGEIERNPIKRAEYQDQVYDAGVAANVFFGTAAITAVTSAILFMVD